MSATKNASVNVRIQKDIKKQAEQILETIGVPTATAIDMFYRQIILNKGIPFELVIPTALKSREEVTKEEFDKMMNLAVEQVRKGQTTPVEEVFEELYRGM